MQCNFDKYIECYLESGTQTQLKVDPTTVILCANERLNEAALTKSLFVVNREPDCSCTDPDYCVCDDDNFARATAQFEIGCNCRCTFTADVLQRYLLSPAFTWRFFALSAMQNETPIVDVDCIRQQLVVHETPQTRIMFNMDEVPIFTNRRAVARFSYMDF